MTGTNKSAELYERFLRFALNCLELVKLLPKTGYNQIYSNQLTKSSSSVGANYIETQETASRKDFLHRLKISRKEAKESKHWLRLISLANKNTVKIINPSNQLIKESEEIVKILSSSINTVLRK